MGKQKNSTNGTNEEEKKERLPTGEKSGEQPGESPAGETGEEGEEKPAESNEQKEKKSEKPEKEEPPAEEPEFADYQYTGKGIDFFRYNGRNYTLPPGSTRVSNLPTKAPQVRRHLENGTLKEIE